MVIIIIISTTTITTTTTTTIIIIIIIIIVSSNYVTTREGHRVTKHASFFLHLPISTLRALTKVVFSWGKLLNCTPLPSKKVIQFLNLCINFIYFSLLHILCLGLVHHLPHLYYSTECSLCIVFTLSLPSFIYFSSCCLFICLWTLEWLLTS
jgi:hypothetical protein